MSSIELPTPNTDKLYARVRPLDGGPDRYVFIPPASPTAISLDSAHEADLIVEFEPHLDSTGTPTGFTVVTVATPRWQSKHLSFGPNALPLFELYVLLTPGGRVAPPNSTPLPTSLDYVVIGLPGASTQANPVVIADQTKSAGTTTTEVSLSNAATISGPLWIRGATVSGPPVRHAPEPEIAAPPLPVPLSAAPKTTAGGASGVPPLQPDGDILAVDDEVATAISLMRVDDGVTIAGQHDTQFSAANPVMLTVTTENDRLSALSYNTPVVTSHDVRLVTKDGKSGDVMTLTGTAVEAPKYFDVALDAPSQTTARRRAVVTSQGSAAAVSLRVSDDSLQRDPDNPIDHIDVEAIAVGLIDAKWQAELGWRAGGPIPADGVKRGPVLRIAPDKPEVGVGMLRVLIARDASGHLPPSSGTAAVVMDEAGLYLEVHDLRRAHVAMDGEDQRVFEDPSELRGCSLRALLAGSWSTGSANRHQATARPSLAWIRVDRDHPKERYLRVEYQSRHTCSERSGSRRAAFQREGTERRLESRHRNQPCPRDSRRSDNPRNNATATD